MKKIVATLLLFAACCLGVLTVVLLLPDKGAATNKAEASHDGNNASFRDIDLSAHSDFEPTPTEKLAESGGGLLLLGSECPETLDDDVRTDEHCLDAIEDHFMDKPAYTLQHFGMAAKDAPFTLRTVLERSEQDRQLVMQALTRPECRLLEGPIRLDLRKICNAEAFFRYSLLTELCNNAAALRNYFKPKSELALDEDEGVRHESARVQYESALEQKRRELARGEFEGRDLRPGAIDFDRGQEILEELENLKSQYGMDALIPPSDQLSLYQQYLVDAEQMSDIEPPASLREEWDDERGWYYSWRNYHRKNALQSVWLDSRGMCSSHVFDASSPTPEADLLMQWGESPKEGEKKHPLTEIAVRLGDERLIARGLFYMLNEPDRGTEFSRSKMELFPWVGDLNWAQLSQQEGDRVESLLRAARGLAGLKAAGYETDVEEVARVLCTMHPLEIEHDQILDCAAAIKIVERSLDPTATEELRMLDEIEATTIEMGIYQY